MMWMFTTHLEADHFAQTLGGIAAGVHARVATPIDTEAIPEQLLPAPEPEPPAVSPLPSRVSGKRRRQPDNRKARLNKLRESHSRIAAGDKEYFWKKGQYA